MTASTSTICSCRFSSIRPIVTDAQNCGNILAGIGPFAIERGLVDAVDGETRVSIFMVNTGQIAVATIRTPGGVPTYEGEARIDGVPGTAAPVPLEFRDTAGSSCGALAADGQCGRRHPRHRLHPDRQWHALRGDEGAGCRRDRI